MLEKPGAYGEYVKVDGLSDIESKAFICASFEI
jgi:hypothetical protein